MAKDDFNFDDMDWPDLDFGEPSEPSNDREPVSKVKKAAKQAAKGTFSAMTEQQRIRKTASKLLPGRHSDVADAAFEVSDLVKEVVSNVGNEANKTKRELQQSLRRFNRETKGMFPDKVSKFLDKLGGQEEGYYSQENEQDRRKRETDSALAEVFGELQKDQTEAKRERTAKELRNEVLTSRRFKTQIEVLASIDTSLRKVASHSDIDLRFKRKSLELQLQSNLLMGDLVEQVGTFKKETLEELKAVVKNTALPEAAKIELSEEFKRVNIQRMMEKVGGSLSGGLGDYLARTAKGINKKFVGAVAGRLRDIREKATGALEASGDLLRMQREMQEYGEDDTIETVFNLLGGIVMDKLVDKGSSRAKKMLGKTKLFKDSEGFADNAIVQGHRYLNWEAGRRGTHEGIRGKFIDFGRSLLDRTPLNAGLGGFAGVGDLKTDDPKLKRLSMHTVIHVIPGLLARIHHEAVKARTGDDSVPMIRYNTETGTFTDTKTMVAKVKDSLVSKGTAKDNTEAMDKLMGRLVDTSKLTPTQKTMLRDHLAHLNMRGLPYDPSLIVKGEMPIYGQGSVEDRMALKGILRDTYKLNHRGEVDGNKEAYYRRIAKEAQSLNALRYNFNNPRAEIIDLIEKGHTDELIALGILKEEGGSLNIDFDRFNEMRFNENFGEGADHLQGAFAPKGMRQLKGGKVINNILNATTQNTNTSYTSIKAGARGGWGKEDTYNSQYQSMALEEIIDVLKQGQDLTRQQMETLNETIRQTIDSPESERYNSEYQTMVLEEIMDILQDGRQRTVILGQDGTVQGIIGSAKGMLGKLRDKVKGGISHIRGMSAMGTITDAKNLMMRKFKRNRRWAGRKFRGFKDRVKNTFSDLQDWYKEGEWRASLEAHKLAAGKYIDEKTGNVVQRLKDVKGDILEVLDDGTTRVVLTYEEMMEGIRTQGGRKYVAGKLNAAKNWAGNLFNKALGRHRATKDKIVGAITGAYGKTRSFLFGLPDVYVKGETKPRMLATLAKQGFYQNIDGDEVRTLNDIKGEVRNKNFELVLSEEDIKTGLVDENGEDLTKYAPGLKGLMQRLLNAPSNMVKGAKKKIKNVFRGAKNRVKSIGRILASPFKALKGLAGGLMNSLRSAWNKLTGETVEDEMLNVAYAQLEVQGSILDLLYAKEKRRKKSKWDGDGDGIIDGSWRDLLSRRKKKDKDKEAGENGHKEREDGPLMKMLKSGFGMVGGFLKDAAMAIGTVFWDAIKWLGALMLGKAGLDSMLPGGRGRGRNPGRGRTRGRPGVKPKGKAGLFASILAGIGLGSWAMTGDDDSMLDYVDTPDKTKPNNVKPNSTRQSKFNLDNLKKSRLLRPGSAQTMRLGAQGVLRGGWRLLTNPWTAAAVMGTASYLYYDSRKFRPLQAARLAQYGVNYDDSDMASKVLSFEEWFIKSVAVDESGKIDTKSLNAEKVIEGIDEHIGELNDENQAMKALNWVDYRFFPVFKHWIKVLAEEKRAKELIEIDDKSTAAQSKKIFANIKSAADSGPRLVPLPGEYKGLLGEDVNKILNVLEAKMKDKFGDIREDDSSTAAITMAGLNRGKAAVMNDKQLSTLPGGGFIDWATSLTPHGLVAKYWSGVAMGAAEQYRSSSGAPNMSGIEIKEGPLDPLRSVRMKVYGLTDLNLKLVNAILKLEAIILRDVKYSGRNTAVFRGEIAEVVDLAMAEFSISTKDADALANFSKWMQYRFMPAYMTYLGAAHEAGMKDPLRAHIGETKTKQYHAANAMVGTTTTIRGDVMSVWKTRLHPLYGSQGNSDPGSIIGNMETLLAGVKEKELSEITGEDGGILSSIAKKASGFMDSFREKKNQFVNKMSSFLPDSVGNKIRSWFGGETSMTSGGPTPTSPMSPINRPGGSYTPQVGEGASVNFDPAGGKYGNVNDIPLPTAPKGFEAHMDLIAAVGNMTGVDPGVLAGLFATESSFDSSAKPGTSTAKGLGQFINSTWDAMVKKYGHLFGIKPGTSPNDPRANALMTVMYMKENADRLKKDLGKNDITDVDLYLAHFLGAGGYIKLYKNPNAIGAQLLPEAARANPTIFYDRGRPRTASEIIAIQANKQIRNRNEYGPKMHAYIQAKGGKVNPSALNAQGGMPMEMGNMGQQAGAAGSGEAQVASGTPEGQEGPTGIMKTSQTTRPILAVDGGGMPSLNGPGIVPGAAAAVRTSAQAGSDITQPVPTGLSGDSAGAVRQATESRVINEPISRPSPVGDSGNELVRIGNRQVELLQLIHQGIETLVKVSSIVGAGPAQPRPQPVNGKTVAMPMSVTKPSSV